MQLARTIALLLLFSSVAAACGQNATNPSNPDTLTSAAVAKAEASAALADVPVPPGDHLIVTIEDSGSYEVGYGRAAVESKAICHWLVYWLDGLAKKDTVAVALATETAAKFPTWHVYTGADQSFRDLLNKVVTNAGLGDPSAMSAFATNNCAGA